jgi:trk system potassium uptake protein
LFTIVTALCIYYLSENKIIFIDAVFEAATTISNNGLSVGIPKEQKIWLKILVKD